MGDAASSAAWARSRRPSTSSLGTQTSLSPPAAASLASLAASRLSFFFERDSTLGRMAPAATGTAVTPPPLSSRAGTKPAQPDS